jgi:hypothetical protein
MSEPDFNAPATRGDIARLEQNIARLEQKIEGLAHRTDHTDCRPD